MGDLRGTPQPADVELVILGAGNIGTAIARGLLHTDSHTAPEIVLAVQPQQLDDLLDEIGFHPEEALAMAAQTALGASGLLLQKGRHPERDIDTVTTPRGCTITGLNELEHQGFSSAMIKGILSSARKAGVLYEHDEP